MSYLEDFLASIKEVKWFSQAGELPSGCLLFDTRADAWEAVANAAPRDRAWDVAEDASRDAVQGASREANWDPSRDVAWDAEGKAAWYTARKAAWDAVLEFSWEVSGEAAWKLAWDASLVAACISAWNNPSEPNTVYALKRWSVWQAGFGLLCDIKGTFYCYRRVA